jgi:OOP family OmpA-OmpF porin
MKPHAIIKAILAAAIAAACTSSSPPPAEEPAPAPAADAPADPSPAAPATTDRPPVTTSFEMNMGALELPAPVTFEAGSDRIAADGEAPLWVVVDYLAAKDAITTLRIEGHTSTDGSPDENLALSKRRAHAVARWLAAHGVECGRLLPVGFGGDKPIAPNDTPENKAHNQRITFVNAGLAGKPIGGMPMDGGGDIAGDPCN